MDSLDNKTKTIEEIFGAEFENPSEIIKKIESYGARYDPNSDLSAQDQLWACEAVAESTPVKEKSASFSEIKKSKDKFSNNNSFVYRFVYIADKLEKFKSDPEKIGRIVAKTLDDLDNLPQYRIQAYERRLVYIQRCLRIALKALEEGKFKRKKLAGYYWGICEVRNRQLETLKKYRKKGKARKSVDI